MRASPALFAALIGTGLTAQQPQRPVKADPLPAHRPHPTLPPAAALAHVQAGNADVCRSRAAGAATAERPRPSGAGRYVVAVIACADAPVEAAAVFGLRCHDVLQFRTAGAHVDATTVALLEQAVAEERLSLIVVLTHDDCRSLQASAGAAATPAQAALQERAAEARAEASRRRVPLARSQALRQCEAVLATSATLRAATATDRLLVVPAQVDAATFAVTWQPRNADLLPVAPVK